MGPITPVMTDLLDAAKLSGLRGVILGWMGCVLLAHRDRTEEGTKNLNKTLWLMVLAPLIFFFCCKAKPVYAHVMEPPKIVLSYYVQGFSFLQSCRLS